MGAKWCGKGKMREQTGTFATLADSNITRRFSVYKS